MTNLVEFDLIGESKKTDEIDPFIVRSARIVSLLESKIKTHNTTNQKKISVSQAKAVFQNGASTWNADSKIKLIEHSLAYFNAFLSAVRDNGVNVAKRINKKSSLQDVKFSLLEEDFASASEDVKKFDLNFDCENLDSLYLDDEKELKTQILARIEQLM